MSSGMRRPGEPGTRGESGHLLLIVMMMLVVMSIMLGAVVQQWSAVQRRENEEELIFRGKQYVAAIKQYQKEHGGALPTSLEILIKPGPRNLRYIRRLYRDPMVPDGKWGILLADPSGRGFINPNMKAPTGEGEVEGLEDLGKGMKSSSSDGMFKTAAPRTPAGSRTFSIGTGASDLSETPTGNADPTVQSVTAPGQPVGPIVGVVSLSDQTSFRLYKQHENYTEWTFNIFEEGKQGQNQQQAPQAPWATPGVGIGPGASTGIRGGVGGTVGVPGGLPTMPNFPGVQLPPGLRPNMNPNQNPYQNPNQNPNQPQPPQK